MKTIRASNVNRFLAATSFLAFLTTFANAELPNLAISLNTTNVTLSWSTNYPDYILESAGDLNGSWTNVAETTNYTVSLPVSSSNQFFRLKETVSVTYILNEGFLLRARGKKVLIDGIFDPSVWTHYGVPSGAVYNAETNALPPIDNIDALLVSHTHSDHLHARFTFQHLTNDTTAMLIGPRSVYSTIRSATGSYFWMVTNQIVQATPTNGSSTNVVIGDMTFKVVGLTQSDDPAINDGFLFTLGGLRFLHVGDNYSTNPFDYQPMAGEQIDVAMINCYLFDNPHGAQAVINILNPKTMLVMHQNPDQMEYYRNIINGLTNVPPFYMMGTNAMTTYRFPTK